MLACASSLPPPLKFVEIGSVEFVESGSVKIVSSQSVKFNSDVSTPTTSSG